MITLYYPLASIYQIIGLTSSEMLDPRDQALYD